MTHWNRREDSENLKKKQHDTENRNHDIGKENRKHAKTGQREQERNNLTVMSKMLFEDF